MLLGMHNGDCERGIKETEGHSESMGGKKRVKVLSLLSYHIRSI